MQRFSADTTFWTVSKQASIQLENLRVTVDDVFSCLDKHTLRSAADAPTPIVYQLHGLRILLKGAEIQSVKKNKVPLSAHAAVKACPKLTEHAKERMAERNITQADIDEALTHPRQLGACHRGATCTVVIGTKRKRGKWVLTVYKQ